MTEVDWGAATRYAMIGAAIVGAVFYGLGWFFHFSYLAGIPAALVLFGLLFYLVYSWSKRRAERERKRLKL